MKYFKIAEFVRSETADKRGINNRCKKEHVANITTLVNKVLDPLREAYGNPIRITSGYRCPELNKAVKGSATSDHVNGRAADIVGTPNTKAENKKLFYLIQSLGLPFDQLINESDFSWVHVSYRSESENRGQVLAM